jgi:bifunctional ADP-heptose synthase (sugar kinase/adenylyltransferase)
MEPTGGKRVKIVVIGDVMLDIEAQVKPRENFEDADCCFTGTDWSYVPGGAANVAALAASLGAEVCLYGAVGMDWAAVHLARSLGCCHHLDYSLQATIIKFRAREGKRVVARIDRESEWLRPYDFPRDLCSGDGPHPDCVIFSDYCKGVFGKGVAASVGIIIERCKRLGIPTVVDPHPKGVPGMWRGALVATPAAREYADFGTEWTVVTGREKGAWLAHGVDAGDLFSARAVADPQVVGAGDALTAGLGVALASGQTMEAALEYAVGVAAEYVARPRA